MPARRGSLLFFRNTLANGSLDPASLHESLPVIAVSHPATNSVYLHDIDPATLLLELQLCRCSSTGGCAASAALACVQGIKWAATLWIAGCASIQ